MSGPIFETHVYAEILKSWWHRGRFPQVNYYRNKDGKEIDLLFAADERLYPVEIKKSAAPKRDWSKMFGVLDSLQEAVGESAVVCLCQDSLPLGETIMAVPVGQL